LYSLYAWLALLINSCQIVFWFM